MTLHRCTPMRAAIHKYMQPPILGSADDNRRVTDERGFKIAGLGNFRFKRDIIPHRAAEYAFLFAIEHVAAGINFKWHTGPVSDGPDDARGVLDHRLFLRDR